MKSIPFARPWTGKEEATLTSRAIRSGWLTTGGITSRFEKEFAGICGSKYALAVNSATAGLHLALEAAGIGPGDKVITSPYTFTATAEVIRYLGAEPLFVDIEPASCNIDPAAVASAAKKKGVKAVIPIHISGTPCDMEPILNICRQYGIFCLEDAAHSFPAKNGNKFMGTEGNAGVYSFYATKTLTTGEGGMVVTDDPDIAARVKKMRLHGIDRDVWDRYTGNSTSWEYDVIAPGYKYNLTDIASAIGLVQLKKSDKMMRIRRQQALTYHSELSGLQSIELPQWQEDHSWHLYMLQVEDLGSFEANHALRNRWISNLAAAGIGTSVHYKPLHLMTYYRDRYKLKPDDFPNALRRYSRTFSIPLYPGLKKSQIRYIIQTIRKLAENAV